MELDFVTIMTIYVVTVVVIAVVFAGVCAQKLRAQRKALTKYVPYDLKLNLVEVVTDEKNNESMLTVELSVTRKTGSGYWSAPMAPAVIHSVVEELGETVPFRYDFKSPEPLTSEKEEN